MIRILESQVKVTMSLPEFRVLVKVLGEQSIGRLREQGFSEPEIQIYNQIYAATNDFLNSAGV